MVPVEPGTYLADFLTDQGCAFIERHKDQPFFVYLCHFAVHVPLQAKKAKVAKHERKLPSRGDHHPVYAAMIESLDESVGRITAKLDELGLADDTLLLFSSDNGGLGNYERAGIEGAKGITSNGPLRGGKGTLYEGGIRVPLLAWRRAVRAPMSRPKQRH